MIRLLCCGVFATWCLTSGFALAQSREEKVRNDRKTIENEGFWIYNDIPQGFRDAKASGKPLLVVLRCIPCEECVKLDDELIHQNPTVRPLLDKFVRVRQVSTNGLDLSLFQYDTDQSFAVFMFNADGTIYGRFGTRSDRTEWIGDVSVDGLAKALEGALELHENFPQVKSLLTAKRGPVPEFSVQEKFPLLEGKYGPVLNYSGNVVKSCIHCHQIGDAQRAWHREKTTTLPDEVLFPYPHPKALGLILDPDERATVKAVHHKSLAQDAGFVAGDLIESLNRQPLLSIADVQWVLHHVPASGGKVTAEVQRGGRKVSLKLDLPAGWRKLDDIAWRVSSWQLRRLATGGIYSRELTPEERAELKLEKHRTMALRAAHVGQYAPHNVAQRAGFKKGDVILSFNGRTDFTRETDLLDYSLNQLKPGQKIDVLILRDGNRKTLTLPIPK